jgi:transketolase
VLPENYRFEYGKGTEIVPGTDAVLFSYGPVMLNEAITAAEILKEKGVSLKVVNLPWLNRADKVWLEKAIGSCDYIFSVDDHFLYGGIGDLVLNTMVSFTNLHNKRLVKFGVDDFPACGTPTEALAHHGLDGQAVAERILKVTANR